MNEDKDVEVRENPAKEETSKVALIFTVFLAILFLSAIGYLALARIKGVPSKNMPSPTPFVRMPQQVIEEDSDDVILVSPTPTEVLAPEEELSPTLTKAPTPTNQAQNDLQNPPTNTPKPTSLPLSY